MSTLSKSGCCLTSIPRPPPNTSFKSLDFSSNYLQDTTELQQYTEAESIDLSLNQLRKVINLNSLVTLRHLNLSYNRIDSLESLTGLSSLISLVASHNLIFSLPEILFPSLEVLELSGNKIRFLSNLGFFPMLKTLIVDDNCLEDIDELAELGKGLEFLDVSFNAIPFSYFPTFKFIMSKLSNLKEILFAGNELANHDHYLPFLKTLNLKKIDNVAITILKPVKPPNFEEEMPQEKKNILIQEYRESLVKEFDKEEETLKAFLEALDQAKEDVKAVFANSRANREKDFQFFVAQLRNSKTEDFLSVRKNIEISKKKREAQLEKSKKEAEEACLFFKNQGFFDTEIIKKQAKKTVDHPQIDFFKPGNDFEINENIPSNVQAKAKTVLQKREAELIGSLAKEVEENALRSIQDLADQKQKNQAVAKIEESIKARDLMKS